MPTLTWAVCPDYDPAGEVDQEDAAIGTGLALGILLAFAVITRLSAIALLSG
ncbi:hypothetical protein ACU4GD_39625 [Cupriavidus basilensis]